MAFVAVYFLFLQSLFGSFVVGVRAAEAATRAPFTAILCSAQGNTPSGNDTHEPAPLPLCCLAGMGCGMVKAAAPPPSVPPLPHDRANGISAARRPDYAVPVLAPRKRGDPVHPQAPPSRV